MRIIRSIAWSIGIGLLIFGAGFYIWVQGRYVVPILTYHHVGSPSGKWRLLGINGRSFTFQMDFIKRHGYHVISLDELVKGIQAGRSFPHNSVVITFDDGYDDNYSYAFPILKQYGFPAIIFLISNGIGSPDLLTWDQVKEMEHYNVMAGAHTRHHVYLPMATASLYRDEIAGSKKEIEDHLGHRIDYFAYPVGGFSEDIKSFVQESGYKAAMSTNRGTDRFNKDLFEMKRIHMSQSDDKLMGFVLWMKLSGYYNLFRQFRDPGTLSRKGLHE